MSKNCIINRKAEAGVTLVEILVVLALIGVMTGAVALSLGALARGNSSLQEAELLVARLNRAADEVVLTATPLRFEWDDGGYLFQVAPDGANWQSHPVSVLGENRELPSGLRLLSDTPENNVIVDINLILNPRKVLILRMTSDDRDVTKIKFDGVNAVVQDAGL